MTTAFESADMYSPWCKILMKEMVDSGLTGLEVAEVASRLFATTLLATLKTPEQQREVFESAVERMRDWLYRTGELLAKESEQ